MEAVDSLFREKGDKSFVLKKIKNKAWTEVMRGDLTKKAFSRLKNMQDAEDAVQMAFERAIRYAHTFNPEYEYLDWFHMILNNCIRDVAKDVRNQGMNMDDDDVEEVEEEGSISLYEEYELMEDKEGVRKRLKDLNPKQRDVVMLILDHSNTPSQAARIVGVTPQYAHLAVNRFKAFFKA